MKYIILLLTAIMLIGCAESQEPNTETETQESATVNFRNIDVQIEANQINLAGEANTEEDEIFYTVDHGEQMIVEETNIQLDEGTHGWSSFELEITLPEKSADKIEAPIVTLYGKNKAGKVMNPNYIPVDLENS
ncbi:hypothetical protein CIL05_12570 [Virgibacillus profundi]|uniref:Bacterial spore germination immunoglobulin-like domain-containing protein n=1 Tax=Virgibacillus profundi TaxID=2024555 RepID=A0A2A2ID79_9BACI|nr:hypothetical protein [Virgibacillus profundi]PAV29224.1 hypothetical protein CIL05_12570 [Virgibacillus profundi]PXY53393.1 hypothetical protein CIT14_12695 [Virgibacillus profundi]